MNLLNETTAIDLQELFGPVATIEDVQVEEDYVHFSLPLTEPLDCETGVRLTLCGINEGKIECLMAREELAHQLQIHHIMLSGIRQIIKEKQKE